MRGSAASWRWQLVKARPCANAKGSLGVPCTPRPKPVKRLVIYLRLCPQLACRADFEPSEALDGFDQGVVTFVAKASLL